MGKIFLFSMKAGVRETIPVDIFNELIHAVCMENEILDAALSLSVWEIHVRLWVQSFFEEIKGTHITFYKLASEVVDISTLGMVGGI